MNILFLGDVYGRSGRDAVIASLPVLRAEHVIDFAVVNGENSAGGFGITPLLCDDFYKAGADVITTGDHTWDQETLLPSLSSNPKLLRPHNYPQATPGTGLGVYKTAKGKTIVVVHLMGQVFMRDNVECPFRAADTVLATYKLGANADAILVDFHAEATSEKMAMGHYLDGRVSLVVGSHTHVPTADAHILKRGTAYQTDAGMCGDYDSVIGAEKEAPLKRFLTKTPKHRLTPASGPATVCGTIVQTDDKTGLALSITPIKIGGVLCSA